MTENSKPYIKNDPAAPTADFMPLLEKWFSENKRELPWRKSRDPYKIWISEIMLQQTTVSAVKGYFERFIKALPDIKALAECPDDELMKLWEGLGYYSRARNLKKTAVRLTESGKSELPRSYEELLELPGIGPYTAAAIASMAYGLPYPAVDGNVLRVMTRLTGSYADVMQASTRSFYERSLRAILSDDPALDPAVMTEGLMELGEMICLPHGEVKCRECPLSTICEAYRKDITGELPVRVIKTKRRVEKKTILRIRLLPDIKENGSGSEGSDERIILRKRKETGLLGGLYEFPSSPGHLGEEDVRKAVMDVTDLQGEIRAIKKLKDSRHLFSHIEWRMTGYDIFVKGVVRDPCCIEATWEELRSVYAIPEAFRAYKRNEPEGDF